MRSQKDASSDAVPGQDYARARAVCGGHLGVCDDDNDGAWAPSAAL